MHISNRIQYVLKHAGVILRVAIPTFVVGFLVLEMLLRVLAPFSSAIRIALWSPDDRLNYDHLDSVADLQAFFPGMPKPYSLHAGFPLDQHGFRTPSYERQKQDGTLRILTIGDSFTFSSGGVPYEEMWNTRVAHAWERHTGRPVELINLGVPAAGPMLEKRLFTIEGSRLSPDIVIFALFVGNDFSDEADENASKWYVVRFLGSLSRLPALLHARSQARAAASRPRSDVDPLHRYDVISSPFTETTFHQIELDRSLFFLPSWHKRTEQRIASVAIILRQLADEAYASGAQFHVVVIPDELQVNDALQKELLAYGTWREFSLTGFLIQETQEKIVDSLRKQDISVLDLLPPLRAVAEKEGSPYFLRDTHWNARGNAVAAKAIIEFLQAAGGQP